MRRMKIVIIDDVEIARAVLRRVLKRFNENDEIYEAPDAETGLEMILALRPDLVITDYSMPGMDGVELLEELRERSISGRFGLLTGDTRPEVRVAALEAGADFVLTKPMTLATLRTVLEDKQGG